MKKKLGYILVLLAVGFAACNKDDIDMFHGKRQLFFDKFYMNALAPGKEEGDTTRASFFYYPEGTQSIQVKLGVQLSGDVLTSDLKFKLRAVLDAGTVQEGDFSLEDSYTFHARPIPEGDKEIRDTIEVTLKSNDRLTAAGEKGLCLVVELVPNAEVDLGQFERRRAVIVWTNVEGKPDWWDYEVEYALLGKYSAKKYKLFLEVVDGASELNAELLKENPVKAIDMVNEFRQWLIEHLDDSDKGAEYQEILDSLV